MDTVYCEREFERVPSEETEDFGGVTVHLRRPFHLLTSEVVMVVDGQVCTDDSGQPVVELAVASADAAQLQDDSDGAEGEDG